MRRILTFCKLGGLSYYESDWNRSSEEVERGPLTREELIVWKAGCYKYLIALHRFNKKFMQNSHMFLITLKCIGK